MNATILRPLFILAIYITSCVAFVASSGTAFAMSDWIEGVDAPDGVPTNQPTEGFPTPLLHIVGSLNGPAGDHVDTYSIRITDPSAFYATVNSSVDGSASADFETRLYLWSKTGEPLLGNQDNVDGAKSTITDPSTFAATTGGAVSSETSGVSLTTGETYLLSITAVGNSPQDDSPTDVIDVSSAPTDLAGPAPGAGDFDQWAIQDDATLGQYVIALGGATYSLLVPEPSSCVALLAMAASLVWWRFRS